MSKDKLIFALDPSDSRKVDYFLTILSGILTWVKVGYQAYSTLGTDCFEKLADLGYKAFADFKFHDIPNTVARDVGIVTQLGAKMINMHAVGCSDMMSAARETSEKLALKKGVEKPILLAVTMLTSISTIDFQTQLDLPHGGQTANVVYQAQAAKAAGLDGVCASPLDIEAIRKACGDDFVIVTPGIRPKWAPPNDQQRFTTPSEAIKMGANYIVVGRPILEHPSPIEATQMILEEIESA